jgi:triosephosphate isomerase
MKYVIGNWKSNKNASQIEDWISIAKSLPIFSQIKNSTKITAAICVPDVYLSLFKKLRDDSHLPIEICSQNISAFQNGAHTGEVSAQMLSEFVSFVIIGHSERRKDNKESDETLFQKVLRAQEQNIKTIYCVQSQDTIVPPGVTIVAYEPLFAIGTGIADTPQNANSVVTAIKTKWNVQTVIYGGSVTPKNIQEYITTNAIDGVLPGGASLDPNSFGEMVIHATSI